MRILLYSLIFFSLSAQALEPDKKLHLLGGLILGASGTIIDDRSTGIMLGCSIGLLKEILDNQSDNHDSDPKDFYYTCGGAILAAQGTHMLKLRAERQGVSVQWMKQF